jgi:RNA polymerase sigma-70 factor, ECF subfamily
MDYRQQEDSWLIKRWVETSDGEAYFEIYSRYSTIIFKFVNVMLRNYHLAEEITQDTLLTLVEKPTNFLNVSNPRTYFMGIAQNQIRKNLQNKGLEVSVDDPIYQNQFLDLDDDGLDPFDALVTKDSIEFIMQLAEELKLDYKIAFHLDIFGHTDKEIAEIMELDNNKAARNLVQRSREVIKRKLTERLGN